MNSKTLQIIYGLIALAGLIATWYFNLIFMEINNGFTLQKFLDDIYVNPASSSIGNDITVAVVAFLVWSFVEVRRLAMRGWWIYVVITFFIAFAVAFPLFLLMRERRLDATI